MCVLIVLRCSEVAEPSSVLYLPPMVATAPWGLASGGGVENVPAIISLHVWPMPQLHCTFCKYAVSLCIVRVVSMLDRPTCRDGLITSYSVKRSVVVRPALVARDSTDIVVCVVIRCRWRYTIRCPCLGVVRHAGRHVLGSWPFGGIVTTGQHGTRSLTVTVSLNGRLFITVTCNSVCVIYTCS